MHIVVITGSPHRNGTTAALADAFIEGAREAGHDIFRFDAAKEKIAPCLACEHCRTKGRCIHDDGMQELLPVLEQAEMVVFVTPLYYFGMSAQLKSVVDRFFMRGTRRCGGGESGRFSLPPPMMTTTGLCVTLLGIIAPLCGI